MSKPIHKFLLGALLLAAFPAWASDIAPPEYSEENTVHEDLAAAPPPEMFQLQEQ